MALIPLNTFKTKTSRVTTGTVVTVANTVSNTTVYTVPVGTTAIILMAQVSNVSTGSQFVTMAHWRNRPVLADAQGNGAQPGKTITFLVKDFEIPQNDAASLLSGKLIIEELDAIRVYTNDSTSTLQLTLSILETANQ